MVDRKNLLDRLSRGRDARLFVISGVAGSGKTSLVCQWILRDRLPVVWYSLDQMDNDLTVFFRYLVSGFASADYRLVPASADILEGKRVAHPDLMARLIERLVDVPEDLYLVLDDYHFVSLGEIHDALAYFLDHVPARIHVVITSRAGIPFFLAHFKVRNQVVEISASDIRFTEKETKEFFTEVIPVKLTAEDLQDVSRHTEGWVGGLQLLGLSLRDKETPGDIGSMLARISREAADYIVDEVIRPQEARLAALLRATALLDRFNADVAAEITGMKDAGDLLDRAYRSNLFLIPLDESHAWYRYHHLFSQAVRERAKLSSPDLMASVYKKAALWFTRNDYSEDAFRNALASGDFDFAADLMEDHLLLLIDQYGRASGVTWLARLPQKIAARHPLLQLHECHIKMESFQLTEVEAIVRDIERDETEAFSRYEGAKKEFALDLFTYVKNALRYYYRDPAHADRERLNRASETISPANKPFAGWIKILVSLSYMFDGRPSASEAALKEASSLVFPSANWFTKILWFRMVAGTERVRGRLRRSEAILRQAFELIEQKAMSDTSLKFLLYLPMAWVAYHRNDLEKALEYATGAARYGERTAFRRDNVEGNLLLSLIHLARGDEEEERRCTRKMLQATKDVEVSEISVSAEPWLVRLSLARGEMQYAARWLQERKLSWDEPFSSRFVDESIAQAELLYRQRRYREAEQTLERLRSLCFDHNMMEAVLAVDVFRCAVFRALKERERARNIMEKALAFGESEGYLRIFVDYAPFVIPLAAGDDRLSFRRPGVPAS